MNEYQTAQFAVGASLVAACFILGLIITELLRKLAKEREEVQRLRRLNSKNYMHRVIMERAIVEYCGDYHDLDRTIEAWGAMTKAASESRADHD